MAGASADILDVSHIPKEMKRMSLRKVLGFMVCMLLATACLAQFKAAPRGKAELKAGTGAITIDYGQPGLNGQDRLSQLKPGMFWRMGNNLATVLNAPVDLTFGSTKIPKGVYSLWLKVTDSGQYALVFNSQTGQWGTMHDATKDVYETPMKKETASDSVENFTIKLSPSDGGGTMTLLWGTAKMTADFKF